MWWRRPGRRRRDEIVLGFRDLSRQPRAGRQRYRAKDPSASKLEWEKHVIEDKGVATEDMACADLNGDGRMDVVAVGRATGNAASIGTKGPPQPLSPLIGKN